MKCQEPPIIIITKKYLDPINYLQLNKIRPYKNVPSLFYFILCFLKCSHPSRVRSEHPSDEGSLTGPGSLCPTPFFCVSILALCVNYLWVCHSHFDFESMTVDIVHFSISDITLYYLVGSRYINKT